MSMQAIAGLLLVAILLWNLVSRRLSLDRSPLSTVSGPRKEHWLTGMPCFLWNFHRLFKDGLNYSFDLFAKYGGVTKVYGVLGAEQLLVSDPRALYHILLKDQDIYHESDMFVMTNKLLFGEGLISTLGEQHRKQRKMLNPVFSLANMRSLLPTIQPIADTLFEHLRGELPEDGSTKEVDILPWMARGTLEYVGRAVLGISLDMLDTMKSNKHADAIRAVAHTGLKVFFLRPLVPMAMRNLSRYWRNKLVDWLPFPALRELREISYVLDSSARKVFLERKAAMQDEVDSDIGSRRDLMTIMLKANVSMSAHDRLSEEELVGQINTFLLGGQETTTSALARILYVLACEPYAQARLRTEIRKAKEQYASEHDYEEDWERVHLPYDALVNIPFLDAVVRETLRVHPPTNMINRTCTKDAILPLQFPVRSTTGEEVTAIHVPAGTNIIMSILGANHEKRVWGEDASEWRPERWLNANGERIGFGKNLDLAFGEESAGQDVDGSPGYRNGVKYPGVYATMMTFLGGGRACIGFKFAEMEIKQIISSLLCQLHFSLPSAMDADGVRKEIYWRMDGLQVPVVRPPHSDLKTMQCPLDIRLVQSSDFC
ncbi:cytochrome P450 [Lentinus tigrinus ALCF2SS1-6]|uniref:Cytochrome P450 n=1 Tax=Lentinus tigrinus ALCF2SS1-6 TaxID=1328759 RepID=A0A5C2SDL3_9APHY|nr:cytochrome P450 [Lentinus tigrinus ALCF2SS1-6]